MSQTKIPRSEILKLYVSIINDITPHSLGQWLKSKTDGRYIIVPSPLIFALPNQIKSSFESIEKCKIDLQDLFQQHQDVFENGCDYSLNSIN